MAEERRIALVTGASSGIGRETAIRLANKGYEVVAAARRIDRLNELAEQVPGILPRQVDLSRREDTEAFCAFVSGLARPVSVLINSAGYSVRGVLEDVSLEIIRRLYEVNVFALIRVTQACLPGMRRQRAGTIVNLSSIVGRFPFPGSGVYASSKYAVEGISDGLRMDLAPLGIRVVTVRPGPIATEFNEVANEWTGDLMARTDPDYRTIYQTAGAAMGRNFQGLTLPGPELIADLILEAVLSDAPRAVYSAGPFSEEFLGKRAELDDDGFFRFMAERFDLADLEA
jgi:NADP-dependent 3-hydroxy acid dehydrogenase YdfG